MDVNFEYYKVFYFVSKYQNLTRAAAALHTSQPAVTRVIRNLENDLGCRLFVRSKSGMTHTPEGRMLFRYVTEGCNSFFKGENILSGMSGLEEGSIYISATETALHCCLFGLIEKFTAMYPNVRFRILNNSSSKSVSMVKEGRADMAIVSAPVEEEGSLKITELGEYGDVLIGGARFRGLKDRKYSLRELSDLPWISLTKGSFTRKLQEEYFASKGAELRPAIEVDTTDMITIAARHDLGIGFVPHEFVKEAAERGEVVIISVKEPLPKRGIMMIYDADAPQSKAAEEFRKFIREQSCGDGRKEEGFRIY